MKNSGPGVNQVSGSQALLPLRIKRSDAEAPVTSDVRISGGGTLLLFFKAPQVQHEDKGPGSCWVGG